MKILVTGGAGFIGYHLCEQLLKEGHTVVAIDNINDYYDPNLKYDRLLQLGIPKAGAAVWNVPITSQKHKALQFVRMNLEDKVALPELFKKESFELVCNLAAQAGVRYSIENPDVYIDTNVVGFLNVLECCRNNDIKKLVYASSSSVYGNSTEVPFTENQNVDAPISIYAATKKSNELMAHTYAHLFGVNAVGLRFFTVYGPWGRPDMAMFLFTDAILNNAPIKVFNEGNLSRDFTYISDVIAGVMAVIQNNIQPGNTILNIGNSKPVKLLDFIRTLEEALGKEAQKEFLPMQDGDVNHTWASVTAMRRQYSYHPSVSVEDGISAFVKWYKSYYKD